MSVREVPEACPEVLKTEKNASLSWFEIQGRHRPALYLAIWVEPLYRFR
jgi:hypothetical protein